MSNVTPNNRPITHQSNYYSDCIFQSETAHHGVGNLTSENDKISISTNNNDKLQDNVDGTRPTASAHSKEILGVLDSSKELVNDNTSRYSLDIINLGDDVSADQIKLLIHAWSIYYKNFHDVERAARIANEISTAIEKCKERELKCLKNGKLIQNGMDQVFKHYYDLIVDITFCCQKERKYNEAVLLALSLFIILNACLLEHTLLLEKLEKLGLGFVSLAYDIYLESSDKKEFFQLGIYIENVLEQMFSIDFKFRNILETENHSSMSLFNCYIFKTDRICSVLYDYGKLCFLVNRHQKAIEIFAQVTALLKSSYGCEAHRYKMLFLCYYYIGLSYKHICLVEEASNMLETALKSCKMVKDWINETEKEENLGKCKCAIDELPEEFSRLSVTYKD